MFIFVIEYVYLISENWYKKTFSIFTTFKPPQALNFQKSFLSGCLRHNSYLYAEFQPDQSHGLSCPLIDLSVSLLFHIHKREQLYWSNADVFVVKQIAVVIVITLKCVIITCYQRPTLIFLDTKETGSSSSSCVCA